MVENIPQFDFYLRFAKPLVLNLPEPNDRVLAAAWIQKLRNENVGDEKLRTDYLKLLLFVLQRRRLAGPFAENPNQYDKLEPFPSSYRLQDVARSMIEADEAERRDRIRKGLAGPSGDYPPYTIEYSADLLEYAAAQDIPNFGVQAYYAMSCEPIPKWDKAEKGIFPKSLITAMEKRDVDETLAGHVSSATLAPRRSRSRDRPSRSRSQSRMQKSGTKIRFRSKSEEPRQPPKGAEPVIVKPPPDDRKPPTWGSNLIEVTEPPIKDDIYDTIHKFDKIPYKELLGSPTASAHSIPSGPMLPPRRTPPPVTQIYSPKLPIDIAPPVYHEDQPSLLDVTFQSEQDFTEFDKMLAEFEQQKQQEEDICICTPPRPQLGPLPELPSSPSLQLTLPQMPQMSRMAQQGDSPSTTKITKTVSTVISPSKTTTTKRTVTVKDQGTVPSRSRSRIPVSKTSSTKLLRRSTSSVSVSKKSSKKLVETGVGGDVIADETQRLKATISKDLKNLEKKMAKIEAEHAADIERFGKLPPRRTPLPPYRSPTPPPPPRQPFSPLYGETPPLFQSPSARSPMTPPATSVCPGAYGTPPSPFRVTMTPPPPLSRPMTPPSVYREPMTPPLPPSRVPCSPCSDDEFLEYERMFKGDTPPRAYSPQTYLIGKTAGEEAARRQYASLLPQPSRERLIRRPIRRQTPSPERRREEDSDEEFERYERLFQAGQRTAQQAPCQLPVAPQPSTSAYEIAQQQYEELVSLAPPSPRSRDIMEAARRKIADLQQILQPDVRTDMDRTPPPFSAYPEIREAGAPIIYRPEDFGLTGQERWQHAPRVIEGTGFSPYQEPRTAMRKVFPQMDICADALESEYEPELAAEDLEGSTQSSASRRELEQSMREVVTEFAELQQVTPALADVPVTTPRRSPSPRRSTPFDAQVYSPLQKETLPEFPDIDDLCECLDNYGLPVPVTQAPPRTAPEQRVSLSPRRVTTPPRPMTPSQRVRTPPQRPPTPPQRPPTPPQRPQTPPQRIAKTPSQIAPPWSFQSPPSPPPPATPRSPPFVAPPGPMIDYETAPVDITVFSPSIYYSPPTSPTRSPSTGRRTPSPASPPKSPSSLRKLHAGLPTVEDVCTGPCSPSVDRITDTTPPFPEDRLLSPSPRRPRTPPIKKPSSPRLPSPRPSRTPKTPPRPSPVPSRASPERQAMVERISRLVADVEDVQPAPFELPPQSPPCALPPSDQRHMMMETPPRDILHDIELQLSPEDLAPPAKTTTTTTTVEEEIIEEQLPSQFDFQGGFRPESPTVNVIPFQAMRTPNVFDMPSIDDVGTEIPPDEFGEFETLPDSPQYIPGPNLEEFKKEILVMAPTRRLRKVVRSKEVLAHRLPPPIFEEEQRIRPRRIDFDQPEEWRRGRPRRIDFDQPEVERQRRGRPMRIDFDQPEDDGSTFVPPSSPQRPSYFGKPVTSPLTPTSRTPGSRPVRRPRRIDFGEPDEIVPSRSRQEWFAEEPLPPLRTPTRRMQRVPRRIDFDQAEEGPCAAPCAGPPPPRAEWFGDYPLPSETDTRTPITRSPSRQARRMLLSPRLVVKKGEPYPRKMTARRRIDFGRPEEGAYVTPPHPERPEWTGEFPPLPGRSIPESPPQPLPDDLYGVAAPADFHYVPSELDIPLPPGLPSPSIKPPPVLPGWQTPPHLKMPSPKRPPPFQFRMPREMRDIIDIEDRPEEFVDAISSTPFSDDYFPLATELPHFTQEEIEALPSGEAQRRSPTPPPCQPPSPPRPVASTSAQTPQPPCQPCGSRSPSDDEFLQYEREFGVPSPKRASPYRPATPTAAQERARQQYEQLLSPEDYIEETTSETIIKKTPTGVKKTTKTKITKKTPPRTPPRRAATPPRTPPRHTSPQPIVETPRRRPLAPCATPSRGGIPRTWMKPGPDLRVEDLPSELGEVLPPRDMSPTANEFVERVERHLYTPHKFDPYKAYMKRKMMVGKTKGRMIKLPAESVRKRRRSLAPIEETYREEFESVPPHELFGLPEAVGFEEERFNRMAQYGDERPQYVPMPTMEERLNMARMPFDQRMEIRVGDVPLPQMSPRRPVVERAPMEFTVPPEHELPIIPSTCPRDIFEGDIELPGSPRTPPRTPPPRTPPPRTPSPRTPSPRIPSPRSPAPCGSPGVPCVPGSPRTPVGMESPPFARTPSPLPRRSPRRYEESPSPSTFRRRVQEHRYVEPPNPPCMVHLSPLVSPVVEDDYYYQQSPPTRPVSEAQFVQLTPPTAEEQLQQRVYDIRAIAEAQYASLMDSPQVEYEDDFVYPEQVNIVDRRHPEQFDLRPGIADPGLGWESPPLAPSRRSPTLPRVEFADQVTSVSPPSLYGTPEGEQVEIVEEETVDYRSISDYLDDLDQVPELQYNDVLSARSPHEDDFGNLEVMSPPPAFTSPPPCQPCSSPIDSPSFMRRIQQHEFTEGFLEGARPMSRATTPKGVRMMGSLGHEPHDLDEITERDETPVCVRTPPNLQPTLYATGPPSSGRRFVYESPELPSPRRFIPHRTRLQPNIPGTPKRTVPRDRSGMKRRRIAFDEPPPEMSPSPRVRPTPSSSPQPSTSAARTPPCFEAAPCPRSPRTPPQDQRQTVIETVTEEEEEEEEFLEGGRPPWARPCNFPYEIPEPFGGRTSPGIEATNTSFLEEDEQDFKWIG